MHVCPPTWLIQHARMQVLLTDRLRVMYVKAAKIYVERRRRNMASVAVQCEPAEQEHEALLAKVVCVGGCCGSGGPALSVCVSTRAYSNTRAWYRCTSSRGL